MKITKFKGTDGMIRKYESVLKLLATVEASVDFVGDTGIVYKTTVKQLAEEALKAGAILAKGGTCAEISDA